MNPAVWLARSAKLHPGAPALYRGLDCVSDYSEFAASAASVGAALRDEHHIAPGDRVAVFATNCTEYLEALYGIWFAGAAAVPINAKLHPREAAWIIENSGARLIFTSAKLEDGLREAVCADVPVLSLESGEFAALKGHEGLAAPHPRREDDLVWLFYTSGTTGRPKGVIITTGNVMAMALSYFVDVDAVCQEDATLYAAPLSHGAGIYNFMHVMRATPHVVPESGGFGAAEILDIAPHFGSICLFAAPTMVRRLVDHAAQHGLNGEGIKTITYGGGPMYVADIIQAVEVMGPRFVQIYGQGECPMAITALSRQLVIDRAHPRWRERLGSVGVRQSCTDVRVVDEAGRDLPAGASGEIIAAGPAVMAGYWQNEEATASTLKDGWLWTGDIGSLDEDGFLSLHDRSKDVIISGGTNIYPREIEEVLLTHPSVAEVAVVGKPDPEWGEEVVAFVVPAPGQKANADVLDELCLNEIARFKRPKRYIELSELPKNNYGKVLKTELREWLAD